MWLNDKGKEWAAYPKTNHFSPSSWVGLKFDAHCTPQTHSCWMGFGYSAGIPHTAHLKWMCFHIRWQFLILNIYVGLVWDVWHWFLDVKQRTVSFIVMFLRAGWCMWLWMLRHVGWFWVGLECSVTIPYIDSFTVAINVNTVHIISYEFNLFSLKI